MPGLNCPIRMAAMYGSSGLTAAICVFDLLGKLKPFDVDYKAKGLGRAHKKVFELECNVRFNRDARVLFCRPHADRHHLGAVGNVYGGKREEQCAAQCG